MILTRRRLLNTLIKHETLTVGDITKKENLGMVPDDGQLTYLLNQLNGKGFIHLLDGTSPCTYTITAKGIEEGERLNGLLIATEKEKGH